MRHRGELGLHPLLAPKLSMRREPLGKCKAKGTGGGKGGKSTLQTPAIWGNHSGDDTTLQTLCGSRMCKKNHFKHFKKSYVQKESLQTLQKVVCAKRITSNTSKSRMCKKNHFKHCKKSYVQKESLQTLQKVVCAKRITSNTAKSRMCKKNHFKHFKKSYVQKESLQTLQKVVCAKRITSNTAKSRMCKKNHFKHFKKSYVQKESLQTLQKVVCAKRISQWKNARTDMKFTNSPPVRSFDEFTEGPRHAWSNGPTTLTPVRPAPLDPHGRSIYEDGRSYIRPIQISVCGGRMESGIRGFTHVNCPKSK